jgi:hypothetical protein
LAKSRTCHGVALADVGVLVAVKDHVQLRQRPGGVVFFLPVDRDAARRLVVVLVDRVTLVWQALAQRAEQETSQQTVAGNGKFNVDDIPSLQTPLVPNGRATSDTKQSQASRTHRATA